MGRLLLYENLEEYFYKLWEKARKEIGVKKKEGIIGLNVFLRRQEALGEVKTVVMKVGGAPHHLKCKEGR